MRFERIVPVAWDADVARARPNLSDGILTVTVPRRSATGAEEKKSGR